MVSEFRLKRLRELRKREVEQETVVLSEYERELARLNASADDLEDDLAAHRDELLRQSRSGMAVLELQQRTHWISALLTARKDMAERCHAAGDRVEQQRALLLDLYREERMLEHLEDRHRVAQRREELRELEKALDDTRLAKRNVAAGGEGDE